MKPTIGRIVHYVVEEGIIPAIITRVWSDTCVNLRLFPDAEHAGGDAEWKTSRVLDETEIPQLLTWHWPPKR